MAICKHKSEWGFYALTKKKDLIQKAKASELILILFLVKSELFQKSQKVVKWVCN